MATKWVQSQINRLLEGRDSVIPDDMKRLAVPVVTHRLVLTAAVRMQGADGRQVVRQLTDEVAVPNVRVGWLAG